jgi:hypothetical protein
MGPIGASRFGPALNDLAVLLGDVHRHVEMYAGKTWLQRAYNNSTDKQKFKDLHARIDMCIQHLSLDWQGDLAMRLADQDEDEKQDRAETLFAVNHIILQFSQLEARLLSQGNATGRKWQLC